MAFGETLAAIEATPERFSAKQDWWPTTITAGQAWVERLFAAVGAGCEAWAEPVASAASNRAAAVDDEAAVDVEAEAAAAALRLSALPRATAVASRAAACR
jgi:hypothetical protein